MAKYMVILLSVMFTFQISLALTCKNCSMQDCTEPEDETCLDPGETQKVACLQEIFKDSNGKTFEQRKCVIYLKEILNFECVSHPNYTTVKCEICFTDFCNKLPPVTQFGNDTAFSNNTFPRVTINRP